MGSKKTLAATASPAAWRPHSTLPVPMQVVFSLIWLPEARSSGLHRGNRKEGTRARTPLRTIESVSVCPAQLGPRTRSSKPTQQPNPCILDRSRYARMQQQQRGKLSGNGVSVCIQIIVKLSTSDRSLNSIVLSLCIVLYVVGSNGPDNNGDAFGPPLLGWVEPQKSEHRAYS